MSALTLPPSVNFHLTAACNMRCKGCFATFHDVKAGLPKGTLPAEDIVEISARLGQSFEKVTFAGGEPTLIPCLSEAMAAARRGGATVNVVTNGSRIDAGWLRQHRDVLDWLTLSVDSPDPETHRALGRAVKDRPLATDHYLRLAEAARAEGVRLKINTVVSALNLDEDFTGLLLALRPERWKIFQVLPIDGQNDGSVEPLLIEGERFERFVHRHRHLSWSGVRVVPESNAAMTGTYAMVSPDGRFYDNTTGRLRYGPAILSAGLGAAWRGISFDPEGFEARGGRYDW